MGKEKEVIAVDIGGTNIRISLVRGIKIINYIKKPTPHNKKDFLNEIFNSIGELMHKHIVGIGIACPGPLINGVVKNSPHIPIKNFDLKSAVKKRFRVRVEIENDAKCVALSESKLGVRRKNFFILTLGTGIGGGVIIDGKLYNEKDIGSELGNIYIGDKKFEELAGGKAIAEMSRKMFGHELNASALMQTNDKRAREIIDIVAENIGKGIGSLINVFNPEIVVLAGGMREAGDKFLNLIRQKTKKYIFLPKKYDIVWSKIDHPGILGAALLID